MGVGIIFDYLGEIILVKINGNSVTFGKDGVESDITGLKLSKNGVIKRFPDLEDKDNWKEEAIKRFKAHIKSLENELTKYGYVAKYLKIDGRRISKLE